MTYRAHDYQAYATKFILEHPVAAIFLSCGLGKSVITLTAIKILIERGMLRRTLVVAPLRVAQSTWPEEIGKWDHLSGLTYAVAVGTEKERKAALQADVDIHIINRENVQWLIESSGLPFEYDMLVVDELSSFKSHQAKRFKALIRKRPGIRRVVGLTGTPSSNGLMDLFAEYRLLDMGQRLGRFISRYRETYFRPDRVNGPIVYSYKPLPGAEDAIYKQISDITVSMRSTEYLKMPDIVLNRVAVEMDGPERARYDEMRKNLILNLGPDRTVDAKNAAALCGKLCQMANGAVYMDEGGTAVIHERKLDALEDLIEAAYGQPILVAYWFQHDIQRIQKRFPQTRALRTPQDIADWNAGKIQVAAIHPAAAGHGLNLQAGGHTLVWFGLTWSLELYQQTNARLWRQGQKSDTVVVHHIIARRTVDENIMAALDSKAMTQDKLMDAVRAGLRGRSEQ